MPAEEVDGLAGERRRLREDGVEVDRLRHHEHGEDAEREAEIADAVDDEGLDRGGVGLGLVVPEADQQIAREADALPAEEHLREVVGGHQRQHGEGEERQVREEPRPVRVLGHVADRIEVHERGDGRHHHQHHGGERVDAERPVDLEIGRDDPGEQPDALVLMAEADLPERDPGQHHGDHQERGGDDLGGAGARGRRLRRRVMIVVPAGLVVGVMDDGMIAADMDRRPMRRRVMVVRRLGAGETRARAGERDRSRR